MNDTLNIFGTEAILHARPLSGVEDLMFATNVIEGWISFSLLLLFFLCFRLIYRFFYQSRVELLHFHIILKHFEEHKQIAGGLRKVLVLLSASIAALVLLVFIQNVNYIDALPDSLETYLLILVALVIFYLLKIFFTYLTGYLSKTAPYLQIVIYYSQLYVIAGGLLLLPLLILFFNEKDFGFTILKFGAIIICLSMLLSYSIRCWQIFRVAKIPVFFRILYLCTLEFVPLLIIYKYIPLS